MECDRLPRAQLFGTRYPERKHALIEFRIPQDPLVRTNQDLLLYVGKARKRVSFRFWGIVMNHACACTDSPAAPLRGMPRTTGDH